METVELFQRSENCFVASGDAMQWSRTFNALELHRDSLIAKWSRFTFDNDLNISAEIERCERLAKQADDATFRAYQYGRLSMELFASEAKTITDAVTTEAIA